MAAIEEGADSPDVPGRMPAGIVTGTVADRLPTSSPHYAGEGWGQQGVIRSSPDDNGYRPA